MYAFPPHRSQLERTWAWIEAFSIEETIKICEYAESLPVQQAVTGNGSLPDNIQKEIRNSVVSWVDHTPEADWFYKRIAEKFMEVNETWFRYNLWGFCDDLQFTVYDSTVSGHYDWHVDMLEAGKYARKLSAVVQLSRIENYEGGELRIQGKSEEILPKHVGHMLFFPSYVRHKVSPVTSGVRKSLVCWAAGPDFV